MHKVAGKGVVYSRDQPEICTDFRTETPRRASQRKALQESDLLRDLYRMRMQREILR